jgi:hypothetical protein
MGIAAGALVYVVGLFSQAAVADETGVSFWVPGTFGSLAAVPQQPGWSLATINYHDNVSGGADVALAHDFRIGNIPVNFSGNVSGGVKLPNFDIQLLVPSYVFGTPVLGGQAAVQMLGFWGRDRTTLSATLNGTITPPGCPPICIMRSDFISDTLWGFGDLYPQASLRWNKGADNWMVYMTGDIPVGAYETRPAWRIWALGTERSMPAAGIPTSISRLDMNSQPCSASPITCSIRRPNIGTASICTSIGARRSS